jgi:hypothetical protein
MRSCMQDRDWGNRRNLKSQNFFYCSMTTERMTNHRKMTVSTCVGILREFVGLSA